MKKRMKPILILILAMIMVITSVPVQTNAAANARARGKKKTTQIETQEESAPTEEPAVEEEPAPAEEPAVEEESAPAEMPPAEEVVDEQKDEPAENAETVEPASEVTVEETAPIEDTAVIDTEEEAPVAEETATAYPPASFDSDKVDGVTVHVDAPENALPEGSTMEVSRVNIDAVQDAVDKAEDIDGTVVAAVDITFFNAEGISVEPKTDITVTMTTKAITKVDDDLAIVHIDANADEIEELDIAAEDVSAIIENDRAVFEAKDFSIYAIIGTIPGSETPYRTTYEFYDANGSEYYFKDASGNAKYTQILKDGEILEDVGVPPLATSNAKFVGWFDENGNKVEVNEAKTVTSNSTIKLTAKYQGIVNVFFVSAVMQNEQMQNEQGQNIARSVVTTKQVEYTVGQENAITVSTSDVTTDAPTTEQAVIGWNRNETAANDGTAEGSDGIITLYPNGNGTITDVMLFPAITNAHWLYFDENDGGTGGGASYTPPEFVVNGGKPSRPADPHRTGYTFGGWYTDAACTQEFNFDAVLQETTTVYAKWTGSSTTYTIIVWVQRTADSANLPNNGQNVAEANRTYDFYKAYSVSSTTGATATVADNPYKQLGTTLDADGHIKYSRCDDNKIVAGNGSTVLNVYYDRDVMTIHWRNSRYGNDTDTWYGLYNSTFAEANKTWKAGAWRSPRYSISIMDAFVDFDTRTDTELILYPDSASGNYHLYFYKENLSGGYDQVFDRRLQGGTDVTFAEKYAPGFKLHSYKINGSTSYPGDSGWTNATAGNKVTNVYSNVHVRYNRVAFNIEYHNGTRGVEGPVVRTDSIKYEMPLANHTNPSVEYTVAEDRDHYDFIGWFADSTWSTMVTFTELSEQEKANYTAWYGVSAFITIDKMPAHNFPLYAGYSLKGWDCALDPNGGEFTNANQAGVFWLNYGDQISSDIKRNITRENYTFQGWMIANVDGNIIYTTNPANQLRYISDDSNWTMTDNPWEFSTGITGPTYLMAKWHYDYAMNVVYDANGGTNPPEDQGHYSDGASTVAFRSPTPPAKGNFLGWDIVGTEEIEKLQPGDSFVVSSDYAVDGVVTLKAVYSLPGSGDEIPVTHITFYANYHDVLGKQFDGVTAENQGTFTYENIQINKGYDIKNINDVIAQGQANAYSGYTFLGWAKDKDATEDELFLKYENGTFKAKTSNGQWEAVTQIAADEDQSAGGYDDLYAVWQGQFYVYHSGVAGDGNLETIAMNTANMPNGTYDLTQHVTDGTLYGGYYLNYAGKGSYNDDGVAGTGGVKYTGMNNTWTTAEKENGTAMVPHTGVTYYIKEVPTYYLLPYYQYTYKKGEKVILDIWMMSAIDDLKYMETGFVISTDRVASVYKSFTIKTTEGSKSVKFTPSTMFKSITSGGKVTVWKGSDLLKEDNFNMRPYWKTPDGVKVLGSVERHVSMGNGKVGTGGISKEDKEVGPTIEK